MKKFLSSFVFVFVFACGAFGQSGAEIVLGNPSNAGSADENNFLVVHSGYILSYNRERGAPNWVSWHLSRTDIGTGDRSNAFAPDQTLDRSWWIVPNDYARSSYDRGHMCPSKDRSANAAANIETFLMSNMQPQTPNLNRKTWKSLEDYTRTLVGQGNEAYIYAGCYGENGRLKNKVTIPTSCFKIVVVLPEGKNDLKRVTANTRVIVVDMPNDSSINPSWRKYLTTIDDLETKTGYNFLTNLSEEIQAAIESKKDK